MLSVTDVHKAFGDNEVLKGVSFSVEKGDVVAILGSSGSGKTTLLRCLEFFERADKGTISIGDNNADLHTASRQKIHELRQRTSFVFQNYNLFNNKNALENVELGLIIDKLLREHCVKYMFFDVCVDLLLGHILGMLG